MSNFAHQQISTYDIANEMIFKKRIPFTKMANAISILYLYLYFNNTCEYVNLELHLKRTKQQQHNHKNGRDGKDSNKQETQTTKMI